jgi:hypothetical protein
MSSGEVLKKFCPPRRLQQERLRVEPGFLPLDLLGEDFRFRPLQHAVQTTQDREWEDDLAVFRLPVVAAQQIGDGPDEGREVRIGHGVRIEGLA